LFLILNFLTTHSNLTTLEEAMRKIMSVIKQMESESVLSGV